MYSIKSKGPRMEPCGTPHLAVCNREQATIMERLPKDILFGIIGCEDEIFVNHILLLAKQYLYSCRQNKYPPSIRVLHSKINTVFLIETMIAKSNNKLETHNMKWGKYKTD